MDCRDPKLAVVMPYYHNARTLGPCLRSFSTQVGAQASEIIVVDDGEQPEAAHIVAGLAGPVPIRVLHARRQGQAAATNLGLRASTCALVLLTCADIIATPNLLAAHLGAHRRARGAVGVIGHIDYAPWLTMTPLMQFMAQPGVQFDFAGIRDASRAPGAALYAPNFSAPKQTLLAAGLFDPTFSYGYQDTDLGLRLARGGLPFVYEAQAAVWHDHPNTVRGLCARQQTVHSGWARMARRYPERVDAAAMMQLLRQVVPQLPHLPAQTLLAERANALVAAAAAAAATRAHPDLMALFAHVATLAMVAGMLTDLPGLACVLPIGDEPWYQRMARAPKACATAQATA